MVLRGHVALDGVTEAALKCNVSYSPFEPRLLSTVVDGERGHTLECGGFACSTGQVPYLAKSGDFLVCGALAVELVVECMRHLFCFRFGSEAELTLRGRIV